MTHSAAEARKSLPSLTPDVLSMDMQIGKAETVLMSLKSLVGAVLT